MANAQNKWESAQTCNITTEIVTFPQTPTGLKRGIEKTELTEKCQRRGAKKHTERQMKNREQDVCESLRIKLMPRRLGYPLQILLLLLLSLRNAHFYSQPLNLYVLHIDLPDNTYKQRLARTQCATDFMHVRRWVKIVMMLTVSTAVVWSSECAEKRADEEESCMDIEMALGNWMHSIFFCIYTNTNPLLWPCHVKRQNSNFQFSLFLSFFSLFFFHFRGVFIHLPIPFFFTRFLKLKNL